MLISVKDETAPTKPYPYVGRLIGKSDLLVMFVKEGRGIVLRPGINYKVGEYLLNCSENKFEPVEVTLEF